MLKLVYHARNDWHNRCQDEKYFLKVSGRICPLKENSLHLYFTKDLSKVLSHWLDCSSCESDCWSWSELDWTGHSYPWPWQPSWITPLAQHRLRNWWYDASAWTGPSSLSPPLPQAASLPVLASHKVNLGLHHSLYQSNGMKWRRSTLSWIRMISSLSATHQQRPFY